MTSQGPTATGRGCGRGRERGAPSARHVQADELHTRRRERRGQHGVGLVAQHDHVDAVRPIRLANQKSTSLTLGYDEAKTTRCSSVHLLEARG